MSRELKGTDDNRVGRLSRFGRSFVTFGGELFMEDNRVVLCGANAYEQKYYFNEAFKGIPESIRNELHIICVMFTEEVGGIFTIVFEEDGSISMETNAEENDFYYDEISSGLLISEIRRKRQELFESLSLYYRVVILKQEPDADDFSN